jgi:arylsulfatase A-like enzyme
MPHWHGQYDDFSHGVQHPLAKRQGDLVTALFLVLVLVDAVVLLARGGSIGQAIATSALVTVSLVSLWAMIRLVHQGYRLLSVRQQRVLVAVLGASVGAIFALALFSGTGIRRMGLRPVANVLSVVVCAGMALVLWHIRDRVLTRWNHPWSLATRSLWLLAAALVYSVHATVLTRQYALVHGVMALVCGMLVLAAARPLQMSRALLATVVLLGLGAGVSTARSNVLRASVRQRAPIAQYPALLIGAMSRDNVDAVENGTIIEGAHLPLQGLDLVLVTVDALRADRVRALGGSGRMPVLDAMTTRGVTFRRAYCATPHTSYSLASLMLGTYARSVLALPGVRRERETLATWLGAAGYVTAAFFPPAVFAVDGERFGSLRERKFGFSHADERYATAQERTASVGQWLDGRRAGERVFVWVHLFEPHEPYELHSEHAYGEEREQRYDAECSAADDALGGLIEAFRHHGRRAAWIVTADHGEEFGDHGGNFHGTTVYDEQVRVPLVMEVPGVRAGVVSEPVSLVDVAATVMGGVGLSRPPGVRGNNLGALVLSSAHDTRAFVATGSLRAVVTSQDKLIADLSDGTLERYDLTNDPHERNNLADLDPARTRRLRGELAAWESTHARYDNQRAGTASDVQELPDVLQRAVQGDTSVANDVARFLGSGGFVVRRAAAHVLGDLAVTSSLVMEGLMRETTAPDASLRREAGVSLALLRDVRGRDLARAAMHDRTLGSDMHFRASLGLGRVGDHTAVSELCVGMLRRGATDAQRDAAIEILRILNDPQAFDAWVQLLGDPRLAPHAAAALEALGDVRAIEPLRAAMTTQRYPLTLRAVASALVTLHAPDATERLRDALTLGDPLADVHTLLASVNEPGQKISGVTTALVIARPTVVRLRGGDRAERARGVRRIYLRARVQENATLTVASGVQTTLMAGEHDVVIESPRPLPVTQRWSATARVDVLRVVAR